MNPGRETWIAGNWKMNGRLASARDLARAVRQELSPSAVRVALCPPFVHLAAVREAIAESPILLGAQDCAASADGAFTGEVSAAQLADAGCACVIVGHSERRRDQRETADELARKLARAMEAGLVPIFCVGETLDERKAGKTRAVVEGQLAGSLAGILGKGEVVVAYEPVWAIGTGLTATPEQAQEVHAAIRAWIAGRNAGAGRTVPILYGGSVNRDNAAGLLAMPDIDGALVGGASLSAEGFLGIVSAAARNIGGAK